MNITMSKEKWKKKGGAVTYSWRQRPEWRTRRFFSSFSFSNLTSLFTLLEKRKIILGGCFHRLTGEIQQSYRPPHTTSQLLYSRTKKTAALFMAGNTDSLWVGVVPRLEERPSMMSAIVKRDVEEDAQWTIGTIELPIPLNEAAGRFIQFLKKCDSCQSFDCSTPTSLTSARHDALNAKQQSDARSFCFEELRAINLVKTYLIKTITKSLSSKSHEFHSSSLHPPARLLWHGSRHQHQPFLGIH